MRLKELAERIGAEPLGDADIDITGVSGIDTVKEGELTFAVSGKVIPALRSSKAAAVIVREPIEDLNIPQIAAENPILAFAKALEIFYTTPHEPKGILEGAYVSGAAEIGNEVTIYPGAYVAGGARIGDRTVIYPGVFIGSDTSIGEECTIYPNVAILDRSVIGSRVVIHSGSVIGSDGFGYIPSGGIHYKIPQVGTVIIEDDVEIGACVTIDRATTGSTVIGKGTKIDNLVQIAHNVTIGKNSIIVAQVGIAGSSTLGDYVTLAGQVGVSDHVKIDSHTVVGAQSGVMGDLPAGRYSGSPAQPHKQFMRSFVIFNRLPEIVKKINNIEKRLTSLEQNNKDTADRKTE
jgi:UDP-3-O-[3-hydroxymyristoyl] glucosamine N-acyltransferase